MKNLNEAVKRHMPAFNVGDVVYRAYEDRPRGYVVVGIVLDANVTVNLMEPRWLYLIVAIDQMRDMRADSQVDVSRVVELSGKEIEDELRSSLDEWKWDRVRKLQLRIDALREEIAGYEKMGGEGGDE